MEESTLAKCRRVQAQDFYPHPIISQQTESSRHTLPEKKVLFLSNQQKLQLRWYNKHTFFLTLQFQFQQPPHCRLKEPCLMMLIFLVYISEPEASAKICVYVFILLRVFIQIYF